MSDDCLGIGQQRKFGYTHFVWCMNCFIPALKYSTVSLEQCAHCFFTQDQDFIVIKNLTILSLEPQLWRVYVFCAPVKACIFNVQYPINSITHYVSLHTHTHPYTLSAAPQRNWALEPKGLTVRGGSYMHQCNLMVQNLHFFMWAWLGGNPLRSAPYCHSQLARTVFAEQAGEWQINLTTQVQQR